MVTCTEFTNDFYKLVNIRSSPARSLYSYLEDDTDAGEDDYYDYEEGDPDEDDEDDDDDDDDNEGEDKRLNTDGQKSKLEASPTPSEAGRAQVTSCSSSETDELSRSTGSSQQQDKDLAQKIVGQKSIELVKDAAHKGHSLQRRVQSATSHPRSLAKGVNANDKPVQTNAVPPKNEQRTKIPGVRMTESLNEKQCIEEMIRNELNRTPRHKLMKSQSTIEESGVQRRIQQQQREREKERVYKKNDEKLLRSGSVNGQLSSNVTRTTQLRPPSIQLQATRGGASSSMAATDLNSSWRRSNGWKRVNSPIAPAQQQSKPLLAKVEVVFFSSFGRMNCDFLSN